MTIADRERLADEIAELAAHLDMGAGARDRRRVRAVRRAASSRGGGGRAPRARGRDVARVHLGGRFRGNVLDVGRRRTIPTLLRRALRLRDRGCRFPGCTNRFVDGHHVVPWSRGGATALSNLCSLCRRHHTYVHEMGVRIVPESDGAFRFLRRDGSEVLLQATPPSLGPDPVETLRARHDALSIDATTNFPRWDGRPVDYDHVVWSLMPPA